MMIGVILKAAVSKRFQGSLSQNGKLVSLQLFSFAMGFFTARAQFFNQSAPLGVAFTAGVPKEHTLSAAVGSLLGYLIPHNGIHNVRYMGAVAITALAVFMLSNFFTVSSQPIFSAVTGGASLFTILLVLHLAGESAYSLPFLLGEALLTMGCGYFIGCFARTLESNSFCLQPKQIASCVIAVTLLLTALAQFTFYDFSPARTIGFILVLFSARYGREAAGAITGVAMGVSLYLSEPTAIAPVLGCMIGGLLAGVFSPLGKMGCAIALLLTNGLVFLQSSTYQALPLFYELLVASLLFILLPQKVNSFFNKLFSPSPTASLVEGLRNSVVMRLSFASEALEDVSQTVEEVSKKLKKINLPSFEQVFQKTEDRACLGCSMRIYCWESNKGETLSSLLNATKLLKKKGVIRPEDFTTDFWGQCIHPQKLLDTLTLHFTDFLSRDAAGRRVEEIQGVIADEFQGISQMLLDLSEEFRYASRYDYDTAQQIRNVLLGMELNPLDISCQIDRYERLTAEVRLHREDNKKINRAILLRELSSKCNRDFETPTVADGGNSLLLTLSEKAEYTVNFGVAQAAYRNNKLCGDAYQGFFDGRGRFIMIVSDGMGKGGRAAVDGTMACGLMSRLMKAGFQPHSALKIVNSAMLYKSTEESLATIDLTVLDLFSGITEFYKAGAPPTLLRKNKKAGIASGEAMPAGIVRGVTFDHTQTSLSKGDIIVMMSDGVIADGTDWIGVELETWKSPDATALAQHLADYAKRRCPPGQEDDITVAVAIIEKSY